MDGQQLNRMTSFVIIVFYYYYYVISYKTKNPQVTEPNLSEGPAEVVRGGTAAREGLPPGLCHACPGPSPARLCGARDRCRAGRDPGCHPPARPPAVPWHVSLTGGSAWAWAELGSSEQRLTALKPGLPQQPVSSQRSGSLFPGSLTPAVTFIT